jgi:SAM-dependent methyltransferase
MIAYGICIGSQEKHQKHAALGLSRHATPGCPVATSTGNVSILEAYNEILDAFADVDDLEALVLLHEDLEIRDPAFEQKVRSALADEATAVLGVVGATDVPGLEWWQGRGAGRCEESRGTVAFERRTGVVDAVDGLLLVLSPWAVANLRFDAATFSGFHAYDVDLCFSARQAGRTVELLDVDVFHHTKGGLGDEVGFRLADAAFRHKWGLAPHPTTRNEQCPTCAVPLVAGPRQEQHEIALCPQCHLGATLPPPARDISSADIWTGQYGGQRLAMRPQWLKEAELRTTWLQLHVPDGSVLELGGGTGELVTTLEAHGYDAYGAEPSAWAAAAARELGARVTTGDLSAWRQEHPGWLVDAVVAFHVFEHVHEPRDFLAEVGEVLVPDGLLALEVPNFDSVLARRHTLRWVGEALTDHVYHYTERSLCALLAQEGYEVLSALPFSTRIYDSAPTWQSRRTTWRSAGIDEAPLDMLRVVARRRPVVG